jgi:hypothetical protein
VFIHAELCAECQKLEPILQAVSIDHPDVPIMRLNITQPPTCVEGRKAFTAMRDALQPLVTPTLVFYARGGDTQAVFTGAVSSSVLQKQFVMLKMRESEQFADASTAPTVDPNTLLACDI